MPRMKILNTVEQETFDIPPVFNSVQRKRFFDFPLKIRHLAANLRTPINRLCFLLSCGYFKASKRFFSARTFHSLDIRYVAQHETIPLDDVDIDSYSRQSQHRQLNKIEQAHHFTRAVSIGNPREFIQTEKQEQEIAEGCKRLIKNSIICWNYLYLSQKLEENDLSETHEAMLKAIAGGSVISWQHINLLGEYDFSEERLQDSFGIKLPKSMT